MLVHPQFDPIAIQLGPVGIHWYGLTYLVAFGLFMWLASKRVQQTPFAQAGWTRREVEDPDGLMSAQLAIAAPQDSTVEFLDVLAALDRIPADQREALDRPLSDLGVAHLRVLAQRILVRGGYRVLEASSGACTRASAFAGLALGGSVLWHEYVPERPQNVILITLDTTRSDALGAYGRLGVATPVLDRLAAHGHVFEQAFSHAPITLHCIR